MSVGFSKANDKKNWTSVTDIELCNQPEHYKDCDQKHESKMVIIRAVPIDKSADFMFIDPLAPLRAVYFPLVYQCGEAFPDLCSYLMVDFKTRSEIKFRNYFGGTDPVFKCDSTSGLGFHEGYTLGFDFKNLYYYLSLPRQLRNPDMDLYQPKGDYPPLVWVCGTTEVGTHWPKVNFQEFHALMDFADVISENFGVDLVWAPNTKSTFLTDMIVKLVSLGLRFVPVVGPMLSVGFGVAANLIVHPEEWAEVDILDLKQTDNGALALEECVDSGKKAQEFVVPGFVEDSSEAFSAAKPGAPNIGIFAPQKEGADARRVQALKDKAARLGLNMSAPLVKRMEPKESVKTKRSAAGALQELKDSLRSLSGSAAK